MQLSLGKLPWYGQVGAFVAVSLLALGGFYWYYAGPMRAEIDARRLEVERLRTDINRGLTVARQLPQFQAQVAELEARLDSLRAVLPDEKDFADLLRRIQTLATQSNLMIRSFKPQPPLTKQMHMELPITLELDGGYHSLGLFFDRISKFPRIINLSDILIKAKEKPTPESTVVAQCTATTFVLLETPAAKPAAPPGQPAVGR